MPSPPQAPGKAHLEAERAADGTLRLTLAGVLTAMTVHRIWPRALAALGEGPVQATLDASGVAECDGAGIGLMLDLERRALAQGGSLHIEGLRDEFQRMRVQFNPHDFIPIQPPGRPRPRATVELGESTYRIWIDFKEQVSFIGELSVALAGTVMRPRRLRWRETMEIAEQVGADALPICSLMGFLIGLIMAFQAAIPMKQFGAELYVADLISLSMIRELGGLITAVILAGRTGSAFAAELGTMKINEEINALQTLGLDPMRFLVVGRVLATVAMMPLLTIFATFAGLLGGMVVMLSMDFPIVTYFREAFYLIGYNDVLGGLVKTFVFGLEIAGIGCMRGLQTRSGASAVGLSATRAVVTAIVVLIVTDGVFSVVYYFLGI